jgi:hypothetical protein
MAFRAFPFFVKRRAVRRRVASRALALAPFGVSKVYIQWVAETRAVLWPTVLRCNRITPAKAAVFSASWNQFLTI